MRMNTHTYKKPPTYIDTKRIIEEKKEKPKEIEMYGDIIRTTHDGQIEQTTASKATTQEQEGNNKKGMNGAPCVMK